LYGSIACMRRRPSHPGVCTYATPSRESQPRLRGQCKRRFLNLDIGGDFPHSLDSDRRNFMGLVQQYKSRACQFQQRQEQRASRTIAWLIRKPLGRVDDRADGDLRQLRPKRLMCSEAFARLGSSDHEGSKRTDHLEIECPQSVGNRTHPRGH
jgi:hypothetical protein